MTDEILDDGSVDYPGQYQQVVEERKAMIAKMRNHLHVLMTSALGAATHTHISMCRIDERHAMQAELSDAMHSNLIAAEQCRQALADLSAND